MNTCINTGGSGSTAEAKVSVAVRVRPLIERESTRRDVDTASGNLVIVALRLAG